MPKTVGALSSRVKLRGERYGAFYNYLLYSFEQDLLKPLRLSFESHGAALFAGIAANRVTEHSNLREVALSFDVYQSSGI